MYEVAISEMEKFEKIMNKAVRKWLGVPHCLSNVTLNDLLDGGVKMC